MQAHDRAADQATGIRCPFACAKHRRVPGKKYPQPVDTYVGIITPEGVIESRKRKLSLTGAVVKEYGFSQALWQLCPDGWTKPLGDDWKDVLSIIILKWSPESCLSKERAIKKEGMTVHKNGRLDQAGKDSD